MKTRYTLGCLFLMTIFGIAAVFLVIEAKRLSRQQYEQNLQRQMTEQFNAIKQNQHPGADLTIWTLSNFSDLTNDPIAAARVERVDVMMWPDVSQPEWQLLNKLPNLKQIHFYDCGNVDLILSHIRGTGNLEEFALTGSTPLSDTGMGYLPSFVNLKTLDVVGPVTDAGLRQLSGHPSHEELHLIKTDVTDSGLAVLSTLPRLRRLVIEWDPYQATRLTNAGPVHVIGPTDAGLIHLKGLTKLETLELNGGWVSEAAVEDLQKALPNCKITTFPECCHE